MSRTSLAPAFLERLLTSAHVECRVSQRKIRYGKVLTFPTVHWSSKGLARQRLRRSFAKTAAEISPYSVRDEDVGPRSGSKPRKARQKRKTSRRRGPKGSKRLEWAQITQVDEFAHQARKAGVPLNILVTIRAPKDVSDAEGKRIISRRIAHLGQALKRHAQEHFGVTVYEKGPHLHAHHLVHVTPQNLDFIKGWSEGKDGDVDVREADRRAPLYITKQRRWMGPKIEDKIGTRLGRRPWEPGASIVGPRLSFTSAAKALTGRKSATKRQPRAEQCRSVRTAQPLARTTGGYA